MSFAIASATAFPDETGLPCYGVKRFLDPTWTLEQFVQFLQGHIVAL